MKKNNWQEMTIFLLAIIPFGFIGFVYNDLPNHIPTHWGIDGNVDAYGPKSMQFVLAGIGLLLYGLMRFIPKIDPKRANIEQFSSTYTLLRLGTQIFFTGLLVVTTLVGLGVELDVDMIVRAGISILFIGIGNYFGKMKPNYMIGIKTPWTLANENVWLKTHRMSGYLWVILGVVMFLTSFSNHIIAVSVFIGCIIFMIVIPFIYSYYLFKRESNNK